MNISKMYETKGWVYKKHVQINCIGFILKQKVTKAYSEEVKDLYFALSLHTGNPGFEE